MKLTSTRSVAQLTLTLWTLLARPIGAGTTDDLAVQAGTHVIYSYPGVKPPSSLLDLTRQGKVGGIILFKDNVDDTLPEVIDSFQSAYQESPRPNDRPLLIMTDQEGGQVKRVAGGPDLSEKQVGQAADPSEAGTEAGEQAKAALSSLKINANLAPVLGVYREAGDFLDQFERSYGNDSKLPSECGAAFIEAQQAGGVIVATAKHFPGLGGAGATENTDEAPVTIDFSLNELRTVDEVPYTDAISTGVRMIMPSWALYPALDAKYPSGLSKKWIQDELRGRLGYQGVTVSDAIEAGGLNAFGDDSHRSVLASRAGMDLILAAAQDATQGETIVNALVDALNSGSLPKDPFDAATQRILDVRGGLTA